MNERILVVEDDEKLARMVELELVHEGYAVEKAFDGVSGLVRAQSGEFDLALLDIMLPGMSGIEALRRLRRSEAGGMPVILLTARDEVVDKVLGLDSGADDYVTKPFAIEELLARVRAAMRGRAKGGAAAGVAQGAFGAGGTDGVLTAMAERAGGVGGDAGAGNGTDASGKDGRGGDAGAASQGGDAAGQVCVRVDAGAHTATVGGEEVALTFKEFELLSCLLGNKGRVMTREALLNNVWGYDFIGETNVVDVYVRFLRQKIDEPFGIKLITTVRGIGYKIG